jgi:hypothetical protein
LARSWYRCSCQRLRRPSWSLHSRRRRRTRVRRRPSSTSGCARRCLTRASSARGAAYASTSATRGSAETAPLPSRRGVRSERAAAARRMWRRKGAVGRAARQGDCRPSGQDVDTSVAVRALRSLTLLSPPGPHNSPAVSVRTHRPRLLKPVRSDGPNGQTSRHGSGTIADASARVGWPLLDCPRQASITTRPPVSAERRRLAKGQRRPRFERGDTSVAQGTRSVVGAAGTAEAGQSPSSVLVDPH